MKKILKIIGISLGVLIIGILGYVYFALNTYSPDDPKIEVDASKLEYFQDSYEACRNEFRNQAKTLAEKYDSVEVFSKRVPSQTDKDLTIDFCYLPAQSKTDRLFIFTSGTHGLEGFVGSAVQQLFMQEVLSDEMLQNMGILFVHGVNPYGFKYIRRVTENNVDFNRNCDTEPSLFSSENEGYNDLYGMLNPVGKVKAGSIKNKFFMLVAIQKMLKASMASLRQAILQGQYEHEIGLYFGGKTFEPQLLILGEVFREYTADYETVFNIDLHTGYGERGTLHLFPNPIDDTKIKSDLENIFDGDKIDWGDSDDFYTINGSFTDYIGKLLNDKYYLPMLFEYGTLNSSNTVGSIKSIHNMILENQGAQFGYKSARDSIKVKSNFMEMYNPSSEQFRTKILVDSKETLIKAMGNFQKL